MGYIAEEDFNRNCSKHVQSNLVPSRLLPNSCLLNPGRSRIEPNFEALSCFSVKEKPQNSYEPGGLVNSLVSGTPKIQ